MFRAAITALSIAASSAASASPRASTPPLASPSVVAIEVGTGAVLFERRADDVRPIASMTKLFAALVLRDRHVDLASSTTINYDDAVASIGGARTLLLEGQRFKNADLFAAMMLSSDNRTPTALARSVGMSGGELLIAMRKRAADLGLAHTRFTDVTGIAGNASTAREMALALREAIRDPVLRRYMTTRFARVTSASGEVVGEYTSTVPALWSKRTILGGKTGWTEDAGYCEIVAVEIGGKPVVMAFLGARAKAARAEDFEHLASWIEATSSRAPASQPRASASR